MGITPPPTIRRPIVPPPSPKEGTIIRCEYCNSFKSINGICTGCGNK